MLLLILVFAIFILYAGLVLYYAFSWSGLHKFKPRPPLTHLQFSVVIPARNEEKNLTALLQALKQQDYPADRFEIIVVDDHSTDGTLSVAADFSSVRTISLQGGIQNSYKKKAIETGIGIAKYDWILATDADCIPGTRWISSFASYIEKYDPVFVAAPVQFIPSHSLLGIFQEMDLIILQAITGAVVSNDQLAMANGANMAYKKEAFHFVQGFKGIDHLASGDDMLLMYKISRRYPGKTRFLKSKQAITQTQPAHSWKEFIRQRIRWASKARHYQDKRMLPVLLLVYFFNLCFILLLAAALLMPVYWYFIPVYWLAKSLVELPLFISGAVFFKRLKLLPFFILLQPLHIIYTLVSGLLGQVGSYEWKGRKVV